jgi:saccharopine dehydrogenase (NAD+, L-lysine-forming)
MFHWLLCVWINKIPTLFKSVSNSRLTIWLDRIDSADIYILLGLGETHGRAAIEWTVDNLSATYSVNDHGSKKQVTSFSDGKVIDFLGGLGRKTAYRFNFSDQHVLPHTLGIFSVSTRLCFDSAILIHLIASITRIGIARWLQKPFIRGKVVNLFEKSHWGSEIYVAKVDVAGLLNGRQARYQGSISGQKEFYVTGKVAAYVAKNIYSQQYPQGVFHMEELFQPTTLFDALKSLVKFDEKIIDGS